MEVLRKEVLLPLLPSLTYSRHLRATWISLTSTSSTSKCPRRIASRRGWGPGRASSEYAK